jgi:FAD synthase
MYGCTCVSQPNEPITKSKHALLTKRTSTHKSYLIRVVYKEKTWKKKYNDMTSLKTQPTNNNGQKRDEQHNMEIDWQVYSKNIKIVNLVRKHLQTKRKNQNEKGRKRAESKKKNGEEEG